MIRGDRIKQARELCGFTQIDLAKRIGINQSTITQIEASRFQPQSSVLSAIALQTGFPPRFFTQESAPAQFSLGSLEFRAKTKTTKKEKLQAYRYAQIAYEVFELLCTRVKQPPVRIPSIFEKNTEKAAYMVRAALSLGPDLPVKNIINVLENHGVLVIKIPLKSENQDAFCLWVGSEQARPVLGIIGEKPGDRLRFSVCHELRHLTCPAHGLVEDIEKDAHQFAGSFLVPMDALKDEVGGKPITLSTLIPLKQKWGISLRALVNRVYSTELINRRQYYYINEQISRQKWNLQEPSNLDVPIERPRGLMQMAEIAYGIPVDYTKLSSDLNLPSKIVTSLFDGYASKKTTTYSQKNKHASVIDLATFKRIQAISSNET